MNSEREIIIKLNESGEPSKGIFWFIKGSEDDKFKILYLDVPNDENFRGNSKNGLTYTHEKTWKDLVSNLPNEIKNKPWNYFPRGRVDIRNNKAQIYLNPNLNTEEFQRDIIDKFNLSRIPYKFVSDGSNHYKSSLDNEMSSDIEYHVVCRSCGKEFIADHPHTKYCSDKCRNK